MICARPRLAVVLLVLSVIGATARTGNAEPLTLGVHPYLAPAEVTRRFAPLAEYLTKATGSTVSVKIAKSYQEHLDAVGQDQVDIGFMGPASYVEMIDRYGHKPLLGRLEISGKPSLYGVIAVRANGPIRNLQDLNGKRFAFGDQNSTMGYVVPYYVLAQAGVTIDKLRSHAFLNSHMNVVLGVLAGDFDAGAMKGEVFEKYQSRGLRVLATTPEISEHVFIARKSLPADLIVSLRQALLALKTHPQGKAAMHALNPEMTGVVPATDRDYDNLRTIFKALKNVDSK